VRGGVVSRAGPVMGVLCWGSCDGVRVVASGCWECVGGGVIGGGLLLGFIWVVASMET